MILKYKLNFTVSVEAHELKTTKVLILNEEVLLKNVEKQIDFFFVIILIIDVD